MFPRLPWAAVLVLFMYNFCRAVLTLRVSTLRDEEELSERSPRAQGISGYKWLSYAHVFMHYAVWFALCLLALRL